MHSAFLCHDNSKKNTRPTNYSFFFWSVRVRKQKQARTYQRIGYGPDLTLVVDALLCSATKSPDVHNLLGIILSESLSTLPSWMDFLSNSCLSAINFAKREPFPSLLLSSGSDCGSSGKGGGLGDSCGINAQTEERCSFGWSRICRSDKSCISVGEKAKSSDTTTSILLASVTTMKNSWDQKKKTHGMNTIFSFSFLSFLTYHVQLHSFNKEFNFVTSHHKQDSLNFKRGHSSGFSHFQSQIRFCSAYLNFNKTTFFFFWIIHGKGKGGWSFSTPDTTC